MCVWTCVTAVSCVLALIVFNAFPLDCSTVLTSSFSFSLVVLSLDACFCVLLGAGSHSLPLARSLSYWALQLLLNVAKQTKSSVANLRARERERERVKKARETDKESEATRVGLLIFPLLFHLYLVCLNFNLCQPKLALVSSLCNYLNVNAPQRPDPGCPFAPLPPTKWQPSCITKLATWLTFLFSVRSLPNEAGQRPAVISHTYTHIAGLQIKKNNPKPNPKPVSKQ